MADPAESIFNSAFQSIIDEQKIASWPKSEKEKFISLVQTYLDLVNDPAYDEPHSASHQNHLEQEGEEGCSHRKRMASTTPPSFGITASQYATFWKKMERTKEILLKLAPCGKIKESAKEPCPSGEEGRGGKVVGVSSSKKDAGVVNLSISQPAYDVDAFLYNDDEDIDALCEQRLISRDYCAQCGSTDIQPTKFISHSFSVVQLAYLFLVALPRCGLPALRGENEVSGAENLQLLDVGSRLGVVLAAAFNANSILASSSSKVRTSFQNLIGVEFNGEYVDVQEKLFQQLRISTTTKPPLLTTSATKDISSPKKEEENSKKEKQHQNPSDAFIELHPVDILSDQGLALLHSSDIVVLNNVFEWFVPIDEQLHVWKQIAEVTKGSSLSSSSSVNCSDEKAKKDINKKRLLITYPSLEETLLPLFERQQKNTTSGAPCCPIVAKKGQKRGRKQFTSSPSAAEGAMLDFLDSWVQEIDLQSLQGPFLDSVLSCTSCHPPAACDDEDEDVDEMREESLELIRPVRMYVTL